MGKNLEVNGLPREQLLDTMGELKRNPKEATCTFYAHNKWISGAHCQTVIKDFETGEHRDESRIHPFNLEADEPVALLGKDHGANATEALLHALGSCLNASLIYHATAKGITINKLEFKLQGSLDLQGLLGLSTKVRNGFNGITITCTIEGDAPQADLKELVALAQKHSPVFDMVSNPVPIKVTIASAPNSVNSP